jgi:signal transduction histidine kinase
VAAFALPAWTAAAGLGAVITVLKAFPADLPAAVLVAQHLGGHGSALVEIVRRRTGLPVSWAVDGMVLQRGRVVIALLDDDAAWPVGRVVRTDRAATAERLAETFRGVTIGAAAREPHSAAAFPLREPYDAESQVAGVLVLGVNPHLPLNGGYREFLDLVAGQVAGSLTEATARQRQRDRIDRLAELDRAKTDFLSNISHELRTPLTLLLAPLETLGADRAGLPAPLRAEVDIAARNARRLLLMVETLLDFSELEAGRLRAHPEEVDLAALTVDIVSAFRGPPTAPGSSCAWTARR